MTESLDLDKLAREVEAALPCDECWIERCADRDAFKVFVRYEESRYAWKVWTVSSMAMLHSPILTIGRQAIYSIPADAPRPYEFIMGQICALGHLRDGLGLGFGISSEAGNKIMRDALDSSSWPRECYCVESKHVRPMLAVYQAAVAADIAELKASADRKCWACGNQFEEGTLSMCGGCSTELTKVNERLEKNRAIVLDTKTCSKCPKCQEIILGYGNPCPKCDVAPDRSYVATGFTEATAGRILVTKSHQIDGEQISDEEYQRRAGIYRGPK
jgi:hypothetical protein